MAIQLKKLLPLTLTLFCAPFFAHASLIVTPPNNLGLVGYWSFNEGTSTIAHDSSGFANTGTLTGSTKPAWTNGKLGQALQFNGSTAYVDAGNAQSIQLTTGTLSAWIKTSGCTGDGSGYCGIVTKQLAYSMFLKSNVFGLFDWSASTFRSSGVNLADGQWHHVAVSFQNGVNNGTVLYVDGVSKITTTMTEQNQTTGLEIGYANSVNQFFNGTIDESRIYNRVLSPTEIAALYQVGAARYNTSQSSGSLSNGLIEWWTMDGKDTNWTSASAGVEYDKALASSSGTISNMVRANSSVIGKIGQALGFNGSNSFIFTTDMTQLLNNANPFSMSIWFKANSPGGVIIDEDSNPNGAGGAAWHDSFMEVLSNGTVKVRVWNCTAVTLGTASFGTWNHAVLTYTSGSLGGALNGVVATPGSCTRTLPSTSVIYYYLGLSDSTNVGSGAAYYGALDDFRIYNRVLSANEIAQLYTMGSSTVNTSSVTRTSGSSLNNGLVGLWTFDGKDMTSNVKDASGSGNNGFLFNFTSTTTAETIGKLGQALTFNGVNQRIDSAATSYNAPYTVAFWVKAAKTGQGTVGVFSANTTTGANTFLIQTDGGNPGNYQFFCTGTTQNIGAESTGWHFVAITLTGNNGTLTPYYDGVAGTPATPGLNDGYQILTLRLGANRGNSQFFAGTIDDLRVYNRALSASEIAQLYNLGK